MTTGVEDAPERHEGFAHRLVTPASDAAKPQTWLVKSHFLGFVFAYPISTTYLNGVFPISPPIFAIICSGEEGRWGLVWVSPSHQSPHSTSGPAAQTLVSVWGSNGSFQHQQRFLVLLSWSIEKSPPRVFQVSLLQRWLGAQQGPVNTSC